MESSNGMKRKETNSQIRTLVVELANDGESIRNISRQLKIAKSTVHNIIKKFAEIGSTANLPRTGRPKVTSVTDDNMIRHMVKKNPKVTGPEIQQSLLKVGVPVSVQTVRNRIHAAGLNACRARCKPMISSKNRQARLEFARNHIDKPLSFWEKVLWTDETKINMFQSDGKSTVWRPKNKANDPKYTTASVKHGGGNVMAWACVSSKGPGDLVFIDDITHDGSSIMDGETYRQILKKYIEPNGKKLVGRGFILQSDNDPKHTAKVTKELIAKKKWKVLNWPSQSPDLNPIEHAFHLLKKNMRSQNPRNKAELKENASKAWKDLDPSVIQKLVRSIPRRLQAVIANKGYATKY